jgi:leader peptidase (prepilin peptidase)/N-methyltransferase
MDIPPAALSILVSPLIGSFISVVATRLHAPATIVRGRSACVSCRHRLGPVDLVPIVSWIALRGRCRYCGEHIGVLYPLIELAALAVAVCSVLLMSGEWIWVSCALGWTLLALALSDLREQILPDFLTLPLLAAGLGSAAAFAPEEVAPRLIGALVGFGLVLAIREIYWVIRDREGIGLGDAKLLAAIGAWVGWEGLPTALLFASLTAIAATLASRRPVSRDERVPFGLFLCAGGWVVWLYGPLELL